MEYTVEVYKRDRRCKDGERLVEKTDFPAVNSKTEVERVYAGLSKTKYRVEIHETWVVKKSLMNGAEFKERYDTPYYCSPSSESYWSM